MTSPVAADGVAVRKVGAGDEAAIAHLLGGLDDRSRYLRWFTGSVDLTAAESWAAHPELSSAIGLLAFAGAEPVGHAVLVPAPADRGEIAFEVAASWRRHGVASRLLAALLAVAADMGLREVYAEVLAENADMLAVLRESGPHAEHHDGPVTTITIALQDPSSSPSSSA